MKKTIISGLALTLLGCVSIKKSTEQDFLNQKVIKKVQIQQQLLSTVKNKDYENQWNSSILSLNNNGTTLDFQKILKNNYPLNVSCILNKNKKVYTSQNSLQKDISFGYVKDNNETTLVSTLNTKNTLVDFEYLERSKNECIEKFYSQKE